MDKQDESLESLLGEVTEEQLSKEIEAQTRVLAIFMIAYTEKAKIDGTEQTLEMSTQSQEVKHKKFRLVARLEPVK